MSGRFTTPAPDLWVGFRVSATLTGGLAHYFCAPVDAKLANSLYTLCGACSWHERRKLFPERMGRRRCKTCDRSASKRGMQ